MAHAGRAGVLALTAAFAAALSGCGGFEDIADEGSSRYVATFPTQTTTAATTEPPPPPDLTAHILAVGDDLVQTGVYRAAQAWAADGTYDFTKTYEHVKPLIQAADLAFINQETLICGGDYEISGSNFNFNSPPQLGDALVDAGFDVFTIANNHMLDKRIDGLESSMNYWDSMEREHGILTVGAYRDAADQEQIRVREVNGIKIAILAYTETLNGYQIPSDSPIRVGMTADEALMERQIRQAKTLADAVIVAAHWGSEDTHTVRDDVRALAAKMVGWGADVILGSHPHTAQTMEYLTRPDGSKGFVYYSLGNFVSAQTDNFNVVGEMGEFDLIKDGVTGQVRLENVTCMPVITHYDDGRFTNLRVYPYDEYTPELAAGHGLPYAPLGYAKAFNMDVVNGIVEANIPREFRKLARTVPAVSAVP